MESNSIPIHQSNNVPKKKNAKQKDQFWKDEKFQELLREKGKEVEWKQTENAHGLIIGGILLSKKQLRNLLYTCVKIYGGLYAYEIPSYAQKYPDETQVEFMGRWDKIITNLEKYRDILDSHEEKVIIIWI